MCINRGSLSSRPFLILHYHDTGAMEQAPSLTMSANSGSSTPRLDKTASPGDAPDVFEKEADTSSLASTSTITPDTPPKDVGADSTNDVTKDPAGDGAQKAGGQSARERAFQNGLDKNNFETEVHQVMGTLNSWWGGVKKQVSGDPSTQI